MNLKDERSERRWEDWFQQETTCREAAEDKRTQTIIRHYADDASLFIVLLMFGQKHKGFFLWGEDWQAEGHQVVVRRHLWRVRCTNQRAACRPRSDRHSSSSLLFSSCLFPSFSSLDCFCFPPSRIHTSSALMNAGISYHMTCDTGAGRAMRVCPVVVMAMTEATAMSGPAFVSPAVRPSLTVKLEAYYYY